MTKKKFIATIGLPGSGKSYWANQYAEELGNTVIVTKEDIRSEMGADLLKGIRVKESKVLRKRDEMIMDALEKGKNLISCDTNFIGKVNHIKNMKALVFPKYRDEYDFEIKDFTDVPVETCIERCAKRPEGKEYWTRVIMEMKNKFLVPKKLYEDYNYWYGESNKPKCILVDMDGTAAIHQGRSPFDYAKCVEDMPNAPLMDILKMYSNRHDVDVIVLSGRPDTFRVETENWLHANGIKFDKVLMRSAGDMRKDVIIKEELFEEHIKDRYSVYALFDDRRQVVEGLWTQLGLPVFAFGNPYHDF